MRTVTLDIQESSIRLLATQGKQVMQWGNTSLPPGLVEGGVIKDPASVATYIRTLMREQDSHRGKVIVCLSGVHLIPRLFSIPRLKRHLQQEAIRRESERRMPVPLEQLYLHWQLLDRAGTRERYFVVGVSQDTIKSQIETMTQAGIKKFVLDFKPLALARAVNSRKSVILNLEPDYVGIILVVDGIPEIMRSLPVGRDFTTSQDQLVGMGVEVFRTIEPIFRYPR